MCNPLDECLNGRKIERGRLLLNINLKEREKYEILRYSTGWRSDDTSGLVIQLSPVVRRCLLDDECEYSEHLQYICSSISVDDVLTDVSLSDHCPELTKLDHQDPHINNILVHWCKQDSRSMLEVGGGTATLAPGELYSAHLYSYWVDTTGSEAVTLPWRWNLLEMLFFVIKRCYSLLSRV